MTVREYIGARYVPLFIGDWDDTVTYEPLSIVQYQGNSYTSRQHVPTGIEITNTSFWALTGNYNAQVEQYRQEVEAYSGRIDDVEGDISDLENAVDTLEGMFPIGTDSISDNAITTSKISDDSVTNDKLANNSVNTTQIVDDAVTNDKLADNSVDTAQIVDDAVTIDKIDFAVPVFVDNYGAIGDGETDCTAAIQQAIDENPNSKICFKGGVYIISNTIFVDGDLNGQQIDLNDSIIRWNGLDGSNWTEGVSTTIFSTHDGIYSYPYVMFAIERRGTIGNGGTQCIISNGTIDCNYKANIAIQNVSYVSTFHSLRIENYQYAGILIGTLDGYTYNEGEVVSTSGISTQAKIDSCYFTRGNDMAARDASCIFITYPDNNISNCITNRTKYGMTMRCGGNSISNTHFTIQYEELPTLSNYINASCRLWPFNAGITQLNVFTNCYFNAGAYVVYTYRGLNQDFIGANLRTMISNSHYTFYTSNSWGSLFRPVWFGGMWYGMIALTQCTMLYNDYTQMLVTSFPNGAPSVYVVQNSEISFVSNTQPHTHSYLFDASNYQNDGEFFTISTSSAPIVGGKYKRVAALVTRNPTNTYFMPGAIRFKFSRNNGEIERAGAIIEHSGNYVTNITDTYGTTTQKLYISNDQHILTARGETFYVSYIYAYAPANVTEMCYLSLETDSPLVDIYAYPSSYNNDGSETTTNQTILDSVSNLAEIF